MKTMHVCIALLMGAVLGCSVDVDVEGGRCDATHLCPADWQCGPNGMCIPICQGDQCAALGSGCSSGSDCQSGHCVDGVCCESGCDGVCESCNAGDAGTCAPDARRTDPRDECGSYYCSGARSCSTTCDTGADCKVGLCDSVGGSKRACI